MEIVQPYQKKRAEFGRMCNFSDRPATLLADIVPDPSLMADYIRRDPCEVQIQNAFEFSEHEVRHWLRVPRSPNTQQHWGEKKGGKK